MIMHENGLLDSYSTAWYNNMFWKNAITYCSVQCFILCFAQSSFEVYGIGIVFLKMEKVPVFSAFIHGFQICDPVFTVTKDMNAYAALTLAR